MNAKDLLNRTTSNAYVHEGGTVTIRQLDYNELIEALREKAAREEKELAKVPLAAQIAYVRSHSHSDPNEHAAQQAAAETLRRLRVDGARALTAHSDTIECAAQQLLIALGVKAKKP